MTENSCGWAVIPRRVKINSVAVAKIKQLNYELISKKKFFSKTAYNIFLYHRVKLNIVFYNLLIIILSVSSLCWHCDYLLRNYLHIVCYCQPCWCFIVCLHFDMPVGFNLNFLIKRRKKIIYVSNMSDIFFRII